MIRRINKKKIKSKKGKKKKSRHKILSKLILKLRLYPVEDSTIITTSQLSIAILNYKKKKEDIIYLVAIYESKLKLPLKYRPK